MFSFHRPKVYRSPTGCCICKAKSSSSRFTDSKKYEEDFLECFKLVTPRQGEICNACVLLVKRWKKLPAGSERNWQHVVDARAGPGMKSFTKFKTKNKKLLGDKISEKIKKKHFVSVTDKISEKIKKKHFVSVTDKIRKKIEKNYFVREYSPGLSDKSDAPEDMDIADIDFLSEDGPSIDSSRTGSPGVSDNEDAAAIVPKSQSRRRKAISKRRDETLQSVSGFIDLDYWKKETVCCGTYFRGQNDEIMIDPSYMKPCFGRIAQCKAKALLPQSSPSGAKGAYSDSSSDSGYDDYSNQGMIMSPENASNHALEQGHHPVITEQGHAVVAAAAAAQGNLVIAQGNAVIAQGNSVIAQRNLVIAQGNLVNRQVTDLRCHETMFPPHKEVPLAVREVQRTGSIIAGCYNEAQQSQTVVKN